MSEKHGFSVDEWELVTEVPLEIYLAMIGVEIAVESLQSEERALGTWLQRAAGKLAEGSWMRDALLEAARPTAAQARGAVAMSETELGNHLTELVATLKRRVGESEATQFCELLVHFAEHVAAASAGPFPGSPRISKAEGDLIWRMRQALGLMRTIHP